ncbi:MAG: DUF882 domain-containing protein [Caulobacteraceae bacterium]
MDRRRLIKLAFAAGTLSAAPAYIATPALAEALAPLAARRVSLLNLHTGERLLNAAYWENGAYEPSALAALSQVLRDHRTGESHAMAPALFDVLTALQARLNVTPTIEVISGYRSPATNAALHSRSSGVATHSLHMEGKAMDIRIAGVPLATLRDTALALGLGGVGYYPTSNFVHVDVGRVRQWSGS